MSELKVASLFEFEKVLSGKSNKLFYSKNEVDKVIAELEESNKMEVEQLLIEIVELKAQKAQADDDCAYWKTMAQKNAADNAAMAKQRAEAIKHYMELADKLKEKK
jgi:uncharacterized protein YdcH (DUF465 family)